MIDRLSQHIDHEIDEARIERLWDGVQARRDEFQSARHPDRRRAWLIGSGALSVAAVALLAWLVPQTSVPQQVQVAKTRMEVPAAPPLQAGGATLRTVDDSMAVNLDDGSRLTLSAHSRIALRDTESEDVMLSLEEGTVRCDVSKDQRRLFSVVAGGVTVRVVGTKFSVERVLLDESENVRVDVGEGMVEVTGPDGVGKRLSAGESWSIRVPRRALDSGTSDSSASSSDVSSSDVSPSDVSSDREGSTTGEDASAARPASGAQVAESARDRAAELFEAARARRNGGDAAGAARLYERFLAEHSADGRAPVAALELGRLRMDQLGDVAGAIGPLRQAAASSAGGLGDDALARLARAYASTGQVGACQKTKARYLSAFPGGVHVKRVRALCP